MMPETQYLIYLKIALFYIQFEAVSSSQTDLFDE